MRVQKKIEYSAILIQQHITSILGMYSILKDCSKNSICYLILNVFKSG